MRDGVHHRLTQHAGRIGRNLGALPGAQLRVARQVFVEKRLGTADLLGQRTPMVWRSKASPIVVP